MKPPKQHCKWFYLLAFTTIFIKNDRPNAISPLYLFSSHQPSLSNAGGCGSSADGSGRPVQLSSVESRWVQLENLVSGNTRNNLVHGATWSPDRLRTTYLIRLNVAEIVQVSLSRILLSSVLIWATSSLQLMWKTILDFASSSILRHCSNLLRPTCRVWTDDWESRFSEPSSSTSYTWLLVIYFVPLAGVDRRSGEPVSRTFVFNVVHWEKTVIRFLEALRATACCSSTTAHLHLYSGVACHREC